MLVVALGVEPKPKIPKASAKPMSIYHRDNLVSIGKNDIIPSSEAAQ